MNKQKKTSENKINVNRSQTPRPLYKEDVNLKECEAEVLAFHPDESLILLTQSIFFPGGGGQSADIGEISLLPANGGKKNDNAVAHVIGSEERDGLIFHRIAPKCDGSALPQFTESSRVLLKLNWPHRFDNMQRHCGEHILSGVIYHEIRGVNRGFHMGNDYMTIDISMEENPSLDELTPEILERIEHNANQVIWQNLPVISMHFDSADDAAGIPTRKKLEISEDITIVSIGSTENAADCVACCGTHPKSSGQVGLIKILKAENYKGMFRLYFEAGERAYKDYARKHQIIRNISNALSCGADDLSERFTAFAHKIDELNKQLVNMKKELIAQYINDCEPIAVHSSDPDKVTVLYREYPLLGERDLLSMGASLSLPDNVIFAATGNDPLTLFIFSNSVKLDCGMLIKNNAHVYDGKGGGRPDNARARFPKKEHIGLFIDLLEKHLR